MPAFKINFVFFALVASAVMTLGVDNPLDSVSHDEVIETMEQSEKRMQRYKAISHEYDMVAGTKKLRALSCNASKETVKSTANLENAIITVQEILGSPLTEIFSRAASMELNHRIVIANTIDSMTEMDLASHEMILLDLAQPAFQSLQLSVTLDEAWTMCANACRETRDTKRLLEMDQRILVGRLKRMIDDLKDKLVAVGAMENDIDTVQELLQELLMELV